MKQLLILSLIFFYSCLDDDSNPLINCQDPFNDCYISPPDGFALYSYSPNKILLDFENEATESLLIQRSSEDEIDTSYTLYTNSLAQFIDSLDISISDGFKNTYGVLL